MHGISTVVFRDEAGNNVAAVEWDTDEWCTYCAVDELCDWSVRGSSLGDVAHVLADHLASHDMVGVGV